MNKVEYVTTDDLVDRLKVCKRTIHRWREVGLLPPPIKIGKTVRWLWTDVEAKIKSMREDRVVESV